MRIIVTSDAHRRAGLLQDIIERHIQTTDLFIDLGDSENALDEILMYYPRLNIKRVCGNCDWQSTLPSFGTVTLAGKKIMFCHGHRFYVKHGYQMISEKAKEIEADICLFGHTHTPLVEKMDGIYYMNPGAVCDSIYGIIDIEPSGIMMYNQKI